MGQAWSDVRRGSSEAGSPTSDDKCQHKIHSGPSARTRVCIVKGRGRAKAGIEVVRRRDAVLIPPGIPITIGELNFEVAINKTCLILKYTLNAHSVAPGPDHDP